MTRKLKYILPLLTSAALAMLSFSRPASITSEPTYACAEPNTSFSGGEELVYKAYYNWGFLWVPAGEVTFTIKEDEETYEITAIGKSYRSYNAFFRVNDYYASVIDKETMKPRSFVRKIEEGKYRKYEQLTFDHDQESVHSHNGKNTEVAKHEDYVIDACAMDLLSVMYSLRNTAVDEYEAGDHLDISMFLDKEVFPIKVNYLGKEEKKVKSLGRYPSIKVNPQLVVGEVFKKGDIMHIWVSDDDNKVPLLIESPISVGSVKAVLKSYKGLRHEGVLASY